MPKITKVTEQKQRKNWCNVYIDGKYTFSLPISEIVDRKIRVGSELTKTVLSKLQKASQESKWYEMVIAKLSRRAHSQWEIEDYLRRKKTSEQAIELIIKKLSEHHYIDDEAFAEMWVRNRRRLMSRSSRQLWAELKQKRVDSEIIDRVLEKQNDADTIALHSIIEKKRRLKRYQDDRKLIAYLASKGFNYSDIKEAMSSTED